MKIPRRILRKIVLNLSVYLTAIAMLFNASYPAFYAIALTVENDALNIKQEEQEPEEEPEEEIAEESEEEEILAEEEVEEPEEVVEPEKLEPVLEEEPADGEEGNENIPVLDEGVKVEGEVADESNQEAEDDQDKIGDWHENSDGSMTVLVEEGGKYEYKDSGLKIEFKKIEGETGEITVAEIELTEEQVEKLGALSNKAWDINSEMKNGTFEYELTLPTEEDQDINEGEVKMVYLEEKDDLEKLDEEGKVKEVDKEDVEINNEKKEIKADNLDHFTVFVAKWNFPNNPDDNKADDGNNLNKNIKEISGNGVDVSYNYSGDSTNSARATNWENGKDSKYWMIEFDSTGYESLKLSSKQRSSDTGPKDFRIEYKIGNGSWINLGETVEVADNYTKGKINNKSLPTECDNQSKVFIRWMMNSDISVNNGTVGSSGVSNIDDIVIEGEEIVLKSVGSGAIWTTKNDCGAESQNINHYNRGDNIYINGANFNSSTEYPWEIVGQPGQASCDPSILVASGNYTTDTNGNFCFNAYAVANDDCGEYKVGFDNKNDNYQVNGSCGDGIVNDGEECDYGELNGKSNCSSECNWVRPEECGDGLVANGSFETPEVGHNLGWNIFESQQVPGWTAEWVGGSGGNVVPKIEIHKDIVVSGNASEGDQYIELDSDWDGPDGINGTEASSLKIYQDIPVTDGYEYELSWDYSARPNHGNNQLSVKIDDEEIFDSGNMSGTSSIVWKTETKKFTADENGLVRISFTEIGTADSFGMFLDNVRVKCLGEPIETCEDGLAWAYKVISNNQGTLYGGGNITDLIRIDPEEALGENDGNFYSLGKEGNMILEFNHYVKNISGTDLTVYETTWNRNSDKEEKAGVFVSKNGSDWFYLGEASSFSDGDNNGSRDGVSHFDFDNANEKPDWIKFVKLVEASTNQNSDDDGFDVDAVKGVEGVCEEPEPENPECGDGVITGNEQCDGIIGITAGKNFCGQKSCQLIPIYNGENQCPTGTTKSEKPILSKVISSKDIDGESFDLNVNGKYLFEASGTYVPTSPSGWYSDAGYTTTDNWFSVSGQYGIKGTGNDYGSHALLADLGDGVGVVKWGEYNSDHTYQKYYEPTLGEVQFVIGDRYGNWFNTPWQNQTGMNDNSGSLNLDVYECQAVSTVEVCKEDEDRNKLSGWEMILSSGSVDGPENINVSDGAGTDSVNLETGQYLIKVKGTYRYGNSEMNADAGFSHRPINIPAGCDCWLSGFDLPSASNGLMAWVNDNAVDWGFYNDNHEYLYVYDHTNDGQPVNISIWDNYYGDNQNNGNFQFEIYEIEKRGITEGSDGCVVFNDVPFGDYNLDEVLKENWLNVSGVGEITVDEPKEVFTVVNEDHTPYCGDGIVNGEEKCDGTAGTTAGESFCSQSCQLIPIYDGGHNCPEGTVEKFVSGITLNSQSSAFQSFDLSAGNSYLLKSSGTYSYDKSNGSKIADSAYATNDNWSSVRGDIGIWGTNRGVTSIIGDLGRGMGVIEWDDDNIFDGDHIYSKLIQPDNNLTANFVISDWYGDWYGNNCKNQSCMNDNNGELKVDLYQCVDPGSIKIIKNTGSVNAPWLNFEFSANGEGVSAFSLNGGDNSATNSKIFENLTLGQYVFTEINTLDNWDLTSLSCGEAGGVVINQEEKKVTITLSESGQDVECIFTNEKRGQVKITKYDDLNGNGAKDQGENGIKDWQMFIYESSGDGWNQIQPREVRTDLNGIANYTSLLPDNYLVCEENREGWINTQPGAGKIEHDGKICQEVAVGYGDNIPVIFGNKLNPVVIDAKKVICEDEKYLPNWGRGEGPVVIGENTAEEYVNNINLQFDKNVCYLESQWQFQLGRSGSGTNGAFQKDTSLLDAPWITFTSNNPAIIYNLSEVGDRIELREVFSQGSMVGFSNNESSFSSEFYCANDVYNYDNWEWINNPKYGETYYCVGFNALANPEIAIDKTGPQFAKADELITYNYAVTNAGDVPLSNVSVIDDKCSPVNYIDGDINGDSKLDLTETWNYNCSTTPTWAFNTQLENTAIANGYFQETKTEATDKYKLQSFILRKDVKISEQEQFSDPDTEFAVEVKVEGNKIGDLVISESNPAEMWVAEGSYQFCEVNVPDKYTPHYAGGCLTFATGTYPDWAHINYLKPVKVLASKIVCESEEDLPNWGAVKNLGNPITETTATEWVGDHEGCQLVPNWQFEYGPNGSGYLGDDFIGAANNGKYQTSGLTDGSGKVEISINNLNNFNGRIEMREVLQEGYLPFTYAIEGNNNSNNVSAEFYCGNDVMNYDNWEWINNPQYGETYHCVAWNVEKAKISGKKMNDIDGDGIGDGQGLSGWEIVMGNLKEIGNYSVDAKSTLPVDIGNLENGKNYLLKVAGTFSAGDSITADAECSTKSGSPWDTVVKNYESFGESLLDLEMDETATDWGICNSSNIYTKVLAGDGLNHNLKIKDTYPSNNSGSLDVKLYEFENYQSDITSGEGEYSFDVYHSGEIGVCEIWQDSWKQTSPNSETGKCHILNVNTGENIDGLNFANVELADIHGFKWNDINGDGYRNCINNEDVLTSRVAILDDQAGCELEPLLKDWTINLYKWNGDVYESDPIKTMETATQESGHFGEYWFEDLLPGQYKVCEVVKLKEGWSQTSPGTYQKSECYEVSLPGDCNERFNRVMASNYVETYCQYNFGNKYIDSKLYVSKTNNEYANGPDKPGDLVTYSIEVEARENGVRNAVVTDLPPETFEYVAGSWTAISDKRGDLKVEGITTEPTYASPGDWNLGDMEKDEVVTLTYQARIGEETKTGIYPDLAWAQGENLAGEKLIALSVDSDFSVNQGKVDENFVGTQIEVEAKEVPPTVKVRADRDEVIEEVEKEVKVLGAVFPATGASNNWLLTALAGMVLGSLMIGLGYLIRNRKKMKISGIFGILVGFILTGFFAGNALAAGISVRLSEPAEKVSKAFNLEFVAMDIQDRVMIAECQKKYSSDSDFTQFGAGIELNAGGDSALCPVDSSVLTSEGDYEFRVVVVADDEDQAISEIVKTSYDGVGPKKPEYIIKKDENSCSNEIEFKTANDGQTAYVEIYRSQHTRDIVANEDSLRKTIVIGPNKKHTFDDGTTSTGCGDNYFYAIRAFDEAGNASGVRAEEFEDIVEEKKIIEVFENQEAGILNPENAEGGQEGQAGEEGGTETEGEDGAIIDEGAQAEGTEADAEVLGEQDNDGKPFFKNWKFWLTVLLLSGLGWFVYKRKIKN